MSWFGGWSVYADSECLHSTVTTSGCCTPKIDRPRKKWQCRKSCSGSNEKIHALVCDGEKLNQKTLVRVHLSVCRINQFIEKDYVPDGALIHSDLANLICLCTPDGWAIFILLYWSLRLLNPRSEEVYLHPAAIPAPLCAFPPISHQPSFLSPFWWSPHTSCQISLAKPDASLCTL